MGNTGQSRNTLSMHNPADWFTSYTLKLVAILTMAVDHTGVVFEDMFTFPQYWALRCIGRAAFPLFCFLLAEGFRYTRNRLAYLRNMAIFAVFSEIPFDLALMGWDSRSRNCNVFCTLTIGLLAIFITDTLTQKLKQKLNRQIYVKLLAVPVNVAIIVTACELAEFLRTDYGFAGVLLIVMIYYAEKLETALAFLTRNAQLRRNICAGLAAVAWMALYDYSNGWVIECYGAWAAVLMVLYNGKRGSYHLSKWFFYVFYPVHLFILWLIRYAFFAFYGFF